MNIVNGDTKIKVVCYLTDEEYKYFCEVWSVFETINYLKAFINKNNLLSKWNNNYVPKPINQELMVRQRLK